MSGGRHASDSDEQLAARSVVGRVVVVGNQWGTAFRFRGPLIEALISQGFAVDVIGPDCEDRCRGRLELIGACTHGVPMNRAGTNPLRELATVVALARLLRRLRPVASFAYFAKPVIYTSFAAALARVPSRYALMAGLGHAFSGHGIEADRGRRTLTRALRMLYRLSLRLNQRVFFQNPDDLHMFVESGLVDRNTAVRINGTGVDLAYYRHHDPVMEPVTFVLAARLIGEKGIREYAAAARVLEGRGMRVRSVLLGGLDDNPSALEASELSQWIEEGIIEWPGAVDDIRPWLQGSSVYVLPSYYREGIPRSTQEAMAVGRAVITTDAPGCRETVEHGRNGLLVPPRDVEALADAMAHFVHYPDAILEMGRESRKLAEEMFDVRQINRQMLETMGLLTRE